VTNRNDDHLNLPFRRSGCINPWVHQLKIVQRQEEDALQSEESSHCDRYVIQFGYWQIADLPDPILRDLAKMHANQAL
jgi:hypothetical protein